MQKDSNLCIGDTYHEWFKLPEVFYKVSREVAKKLTVYEYKSKS